jgi:hypothetical protein
MDWDITWRPGIGDPDFMGWFTVFAYFAVAVLCAATRRAVRDRIPQPELGRQYRVWSATTAFLVALGINKQLDVQTLFTEIGRAVLKRNGWMPIHRIIQFDFMVGFTSVAALFLVVSAWLVRKRRREYWLLMLGVTFTVVFIVLRASSFHHFDVFLGTHYLGVKMNHALELTGIGVMGLAAWTRLRYARSRASIRPATTNEPRA